MHVELGGETHVLALECDGCKTLKALKVMIAEAVAEVAGVDVAPAALSVDAEDEEEGARRSIRTTTSRAGGCGALAPRH